MASLSTDSQGRRRLQFVFAGKRQSLRLGRISMDAADVIRAHVEHLQYCLEKNKPWCPATVHWVDDLQQSAAPILARLTEVGLVPRSYVQDAYAEQRDDLLGAFIDAYIAGRAKLKPNTHRNYEQTKKHLINHFGRLRDLASITPGDADDWREGLLRKGMSEATLSREVKRARQFFRAAVRRKLIADNPFADLPAPAQVNPKREYFITKEQADKVLEACPDAEWRLIVALCRYGGLRCPSEVLLLRWEDVNWEQNKITIRSPKTEHHPRGDMRTIPLFPELRIHLETAFEQADVGAVYCVTRYRDRNQNLRTQLERIIYRAGLTPWPKLFQNLRATRETELTEKFPLHVVTAWIGNSAPIAAKHYLQVTDSHFEQAVQGVVQKVVQNSPVSDRKGLDKKPVRPEIPKEYGPLRLCTEVHVPPRGVEPLFSD